MATRLDFSTFIRDLQQMGFYDYFLPFILIFAVVYALLDRSKILTDKKNINVVISFAIGLILIVQQPVVEIINTFLQKSSLIIVVIFVALLVIFLISGSTVVKNKPGKGILILVIVLALIWALSPNLGISFPFWSSLTDRTKNLLLMLLLFIILPLVVASGKDNQQGGNIFSRILGHASELFEEDQERKGGRK